MGKKNNHNPKFSPRREALHRIIFGADTPQGKAFDIILMILIIGSVIAVMLESVSEIREQHQNLFYIIEWIFTILFTIEYGLRIYCVYRPRKYIFSFYGIIDLLSIIPTYLSIFVPGTQFLLTIRALRLMRVFRIFKLMKFLREGTMIVAALRASRAKITVFVVFILLMVIIVGSIMYLVEGGVPNSKFTSIPRSVYWAIVTLTTVGYGDIAPTTEFGQFIAAFVMIMGYAVIAVPTGIVTTEIIAQAPRRDKKGKAVEMTAQSCRYCGGEGHDSDAVYCKHCGEFLNGEDERKEQD